MEEGPHIDFSSVNKLRNSTCSKIHKKPNIVIQFAKDKIMSFGFDPNVGIMKDQAKGSKLFQGRLQGL